MITLFRVRVIIIYANKIKMNKLYFTENDDEFCYEKSNKIKL